jgi:steroid 5-alpha reductase family enzyme
MVETILVILTCYIVLFWISIKLKDNSIADVFWGLWFVIISLTLFLFESEKNIAQILTLMCISIWWLRLFFLFFSRKIKKTWEDPRYWKWRDEWKYFYTRSFFQVYLLQMALMFIIATPLFFVFLNSEVNSYFLIIGLMIALIWLWFEAFADYQVKRFIKNKKKWENVVYTEWLYKYSRNPNYFWESTFWLGISIISLHISIFWILWYLAITFLLLKVSGVPMKEKSHSKKDNWQPYASKTNTFFPWFPKD